MSQSLYKGKTRFDREQLIFAVDCILIGAIDRLDGSLPGDIDFDERKALCNGVDDDPKGLTPYERGGLETAGMALSVLYAQLTDDGMGIYDALACAARFDDAMEAMIHAAWKDEGAAFKRRQQRLRAKGGSWTERQLHGKAWVDTRKHAEAFVDEVLEGYLVGG